jgi:Mycothiol maleylpyruvate isomerase N-terminal domain
MERLTREGETAPSRFAPWVEPIARELRETRVAISVVASAIPDAGWSYRSPNPDWTFKDLLAHLAVSHWPFFGQMQTPRVEDGRHSRCAPNHEDIANETNSLEERAGHGAVAANVRYA